MALFSDNITFKYQSDVADEAFLDAIDPGNRQTGLLKGEIAILSNGGGLKLYTLDSNSQPQVIQARLEDLPGVDIANPQAGQVLVYNSDPGSTNVPPQYPGRPLEKWINVAAPRADLSANSIYELGDVANPYDNQFDPVRNSFDAGYTLVWSPYNAPDTNGFLGQWVIGPGVRNVTLGYFQDVELDAQPLDGQTILWNASTQKWNNGFYPDGLNDLTDVDIQNPAAEDGDVLLYDETRNLWVAGAVAGGNANVEIIEEDEPLPVAELKTLGVGQPSGDFYWVQEDNTNNWAKARQAGEVEFGDFKDVDMDGIKEGQTLRWSYVDGQFKFVPSDIAPLPIIYQVRRETSQSFALSCYGVEGGRYYTTTNILNPGGIRYGLGMYGDSPSEGKIHVSYDLTDRVAQENGEQTYVNGVLKFPSDLVPDVNAGVWGIRPLNAGGSIPFPEVQRLSNSGYDDEFRVTLAFRPTNVNRNCVLFDYESFKISLISGQLVTEMRLNGTVYTTTWNAGLVDDEDTYILWGLSSDNGGAGRSEVCYVNANPIVDSQGRQEISRPNNARLDNPVITSAPYPVIGENYVGYLAQCSVYLGGDPYSNVLNPVDQPEGTFPITKDQAGGLVTIQDTANSENDETVLILKQYDPQTWASDSNYFLYSGFGNSTRLQDLRDVKSEDFENSSGYLYWDASQQLFVLQDGPGSFTGEYQLQRARDVEIYQKIDGAVSNQFIENGQILAWDEQDRKFYPASTNLSFRLNDAEDVDTDAGQLQEGSVLYWNPGTAEWIPGLAPPGFEDSLDDLTDVTINELLLENGQTLLYSEARQEWTNAPAPRYGAEELGDLRDVDDTGVQDGQILAFNDATGKWEPSESLVPQQLDDLIDVDVTSRPPVDGQSLEWNGFVWAPGRYRQGGASRMRDLYDINITEDAREGQGLIWNGNYWQNAEVHSGRGDGGDFTTGLVRASFTSGIWGGGDWTTGEEDKPMELMGQGVFQGGGEFF